MDAQRMVDTPGPPCIKVSVTGLPWYADADTNVSNVLLSTTRATLNFYWPSWPTYFVRTADDRQNVTGAKASAAGSQSGSYRLQRTLFVRADAPPYGVIQ